ncbi:DUF948 domain-containing protein [Paenibacillus sp. GCM10023252]|uniref:DUF948 domain-containing protein n=1 Tax=Paenibacillus sp. GCM10023252 TaxID=3252649 RepID=UPI003623D39C
MVWEISVAIIALAFVVLVYYLIQTLKSLKHSLDEVRSTMVEVKNEIADISVEVKGVVLKTNQMTSDVQTKLKSLDPLFGSVSDIGQVVHELTSTVKQSAVSLIGVIRDRSNTLKSAYKREIQPGIVPMNTNQVNADKPQIKLDSIINGIAVSMNIWEKLSSRRAKQHAAVQK